MDTLLVFIEAGSSVAAIGDIQNLAHVRLGQNADFLSAAKGIDDGVSLRYHTAVVIHCLGRVGVAQALAHILARKMRLAVDQDGPARSPFRR